MADLDYEHKIYIPGNHDIVVDQQKGYARQSLLEESNCLCLINNRMEIDGIKLYGSPFTPLNSRWAFHYDRKIGENVWGSIPEDTDILLTHTPPRGILDDVHGRKLGCVDLLNKVESLNLKLHLFGHIHESHGYAVRGNTHFYNCAIMDGTYAPTNPPTLIDYENLYS